MKISEKYDPNFNYKICAICQYCTNPTCDSYFCLEKNKETFKFGTCSKWKPSVSVFSTNVRNCYTCVYRLKTMCVNSKSKFRDLTKDFRVFRIDELEKYVCDCWAPNFALYIFETAVPKK